jgi:antitoxin MazE
MRAKLVSIGNSKGIRLPRAIIEQVGLTDQVDLEVKGGSLIVRPVRPLRTGWEASFRKMHENGRDHLLDEADAHGISERDAREWTW